MNSLICVFVTCWNVVVFVTIKHAKYESKHTEVIMNVHIVWRQVSLTLSLQISRE